MATSQKQQTERNILKHKNYMKFIKKHYKFTFKEYIPMIKLLIKTERRKARS